MNHEAGSLPDLVQNLVKNWGIGASFKTKLSDWRTINPDEYSFSINGREPQSGEDMLKVGTYNAIIQPGNEYYSPQKSDFAQSHKTFKRMMPTFAWEVLDVIGAPPVVGVKWRHWGDMRDDYVGFNDKGEKVTAKAHGGPIEVKGTTWAWVDDRVRVKKLETWFDPMEMFRQIAPNGIINKETVKLEKEGIIVDDFGVRQQSSEIITDGKTVANTGSKSNADNRTTNGVSTSEADIVAHSEHGSSTNDRLTSSSMQAEHKVASQSGTVAKEGIAMALPADDERTHEAYVEMSKVTPMQCPFMNKE